MSEEHDVYEVTIETTVRIEVDPAYRDEYGTLIEPERLEGIYTMESREDVLEHLAYNAVINGQRDATRLDGWANVPAEHLSMDVTDFHLLDVTSPRAEDQQ